MAYIHGMRFIHDDKLVRPWNGARKCVNVVAIFVTFSLSIVSNTFSCMHVQMIWKPAIIERRPSLLQNIYMKTLQTSVGNCAEGRKFSPPTERKSQVQGYGKRDYAICSSEMRLRRNIRKWQSNRRWKTRSEARERQTETETNGPYVVFRIRQNVKTRVCCIEEKNDENGFIVLFVCNIHLSSCQTAVTIQRLVRSRWLGDYKRNYNLITRALESRISCQCFIIWATQFSDEEMN